MFRQVGDVAAEDGIRNLGEGDHPREARARRHQDEHHRGDQPRGEGHTGQVLQGHAAIDQHLENQRVDHRDRGGLRRREHARVDAADDDHREARRQAGALQGLEACGPVRLGLRSDAQLPRLPHAVEREQHQDHQPRADTGDEQVTHRGTGRDAIDDHADGGRNQQRDIGGIDDQRDGELVTVTGFQQPRAQRAPHRHHRGLGGAGHRAEQGAAQRGGHRQATAPVADEALDQIQQALGSGALEHDIGRQNEHRHRRQHHRLQATDHLLDHQLRLEEGKIAEQQEKGADAQWHHHGYPKQQQPHHHEQNPHRSFRPWVNEV